MVKNREERAIDSRDLEDLLTKHKERLSSIYWINQINCLLKTVEEI